MIKQSALETKSARAKLPIAKKPVYIRIDRGLNLGYRRNQGAGTWIARTADGKGGSNIKSIGIADDQDPADGNRVLDFWQAQDRARKLHKPGEPTPDNVVTLGLALDRYEEALSNRGKDPHNVSRVRRHLPVELARKSVTELDANELGKWRDGLLKQLVVAGVNRITIAVKAALNLAAEHDKRISDRHAWTVGLKALENGHVARNVILKDDEVRRLIAEAYTMDSSFGLLIETCATSGARISQLLRTTVGDVRLEPPALYIPRSKKGRGDKKTTHSPVPIKAELLDKFDLTRGGAEPLLMRKKKDRSIPWGRATHLWWFARLAERCNLGPEVTLYALRHSSIVRQLLAGVPIRIVATGHDTSVAMIEKTYSRYISDHADELIRRALL